MLAGAPWPPSATWARPARRSPYKVGALQILKLRGGAQAALGEKFDLRDFHEAVLGAGPLPIDLLRQRVRVGRSPCRL